ncbi:hypothetical protein G7Y29_07890 [Corynebacterium qintianiae]|uniref:EcsC family protein n=1 Tax=Corynebacterium qintianiae TaxID=2709392 RepID=A0A7T0PEG5_9CORY|nr:hypothetical protein [Corynebacterium qintianiae]QPK82785.1 hypothetical protein G7Y29_07890 [Corynebacterium qintianiae]
MSENPSDNFDNEELAKVIENFDFDVEEHGDVEEILEAEILAPDVNPEDVEDKSLRQIVAEQNSQAEQVAVAFLKKVLRLRFVKIDREQFLRSELKQRWVSDEDIERAISTDVVTAGIKPEILDDIAKSAIDFETRKSSALSFASGLGGVFVMAGSLPADLVQYYVHAFRVMQKLAYVYGWKSFFEQSDEVSDEVLAQFATFLGVMLGVGGAANGIRNFMVQMAAPAIQKNLARKALTKTAWYPIVKKTLRMVGVKITRDSVGRAAGKVVPVVGGVIGGSMTYVALRSESRRLQSTLREIPAPHSTSGVSYFGVDLTKADEEAGEVKTSATARLAGAVRDNASAWKSKARLPFRQGKSKDPEAE